MTRVFVTTAALLGFTAAGCMHAGMAGGHAAGATAQPAARAPASTHANACPMDVPGAQLAFAELPDGAAVTFTTTPDQAEALRARVHAMADMHNAHHTGGGAGDAGAHAHGGMMMGGHGAGHAAPEGGAMPMPPPSRAAVDDVPNGARLVVTPNDPADLEQLRSTVRAHAEQMQQHGCGGMRGG